MEHLCNPFCLSVNLSGNSVSLFCLSVSLYKHSAILVLCLSSYMSTHVSTAHRIRQTLSIWLVLCLCLPISCQVSVPLPFCLFLFICLPVCLSKLHNMSAEYLSVGLVCFLSTCLTALCLFYSMFLVHMPTTCLYYDLFV